MLSVPFLVACRPWNGTAHGKEFGHFEYQPGGTRGDGQEEQQPLPGRRKLCPGKKALEKILSEISGQYFTRVLSLRTEFLPPF